MRSEKKAVMHKKKPYAEGAWDMFMIILTSVQVSCVIHDLIQIGSIILCIEDKKEARGVDISKDLLLFLPYYVSLKKYQKRKTTGRISNHAKKRDGYRK